MFIPTIGMRLIIGGLKCLRTRFGSAARLPATIYVDVNKCEMFMWEWS